MPTPPPAETPLAVRHEPQHRRFVVTLPDGEAELVYAPFSDDVIDLQHTAVPESAQGHGVGDLLVRAALEYARSQRLKVIATCPYVQAWLRRHPAERP
jgi:predicted GNAT family acetyltransferase